MLVGVLETAAIDHRAFAALFPGHDGWSFGIIFKTLYYDDENQRALDYYCVMMMIEETVLFLNCEGTSARIRFIL